MAHLEAASQPSVAAALRPRQIKSLMSPCQIVVANLHRARALDGDVADRCGSDDRRGA